MPERRPTDRHSTITFWGGNKAMNERVKYANYVAAQFKAHNTTGLWWMGLFDRKTLTWTEPQLVSALMKVLNK